MPGRLTPLANEQIYHIYNRGIDHQPTFIQKNDYKRALETLKYYHYISPPVRLSIYLILGVDKKIEISSSLKNSPVHADIISYCLMPNHFHLLIRQKVDHGISKFLSNFQNSFTRYFNTKNHRSGPLFTNQFKAVLIETDKQLLHVHRYIHLNPYTSYVVKDIKNIFTYPWSSMAEYLSFKDNVCRQKIIRDYFKQINTYQRFILDQADYQRKLQSIKHLTFE